MGFFHVFSLTFCPTDSKTTRNLTKARILPIKHEYNILPGDVTKETLQLDLHGNNNPTKAVVKETNQNNVVNFETSNYIYFEPGKGRLGNYLFSFASASGIAHNANRTLIWNPKLKKLTQLLSGLDLTFEPPNKYENWTLIKEKVKLSFDESLFNLPEGNLHVYGYLQSFTYFEKIGEYIFNTYSQIQSKFLEQARIFTENAKSQAKSILSYQSPTTVCVHVRRGDVLLERRISSGTISVSAKDIKLAMSYMEKKFSQVIFFVASDDPQWCQEHLKKENVFLSNLASPEEDYTLLQSCDHMIMTTGTYGWWAGWMTSYRGGEVMYYRYPMTVGSFLWRHFDRKTYYPGHWLSYGNDSVVVSKDVVDPL